jgi:hypothetical protein
MAKEVKTPETKATDKEVMAGLIDLLKKNPKIKKVYFNENGDFYLHSHKVTVHELNDLGFSVSTKEVECCPGVKWGIAKITNELNKNVISKRVNVEYVPVAKILTREEILN